MAPGAAIRIGIGAGEDPFPDERIAIVATGYGKLLLVPIVAKGFR